MQDEILYIYSDIEEIESIESKNQHERERDNFINNYETNKKALEEINENISKSNIPKKKISSLNNLKEKSKTDNMIKNENISRISKFFKRKKKLRRRKVKRDIRMVRSQDIFDDIKEKEKENINKNTNEMKLKIHINKINNDKLYSKSYDKNIFNKENIIDKIIKKKNNYLYDNDDNDDNDEDSDAPSNTFLIFGTQNDDTENYNINQINKNILLGRKRMEEFNSLKIDNRSNSEISAPPAIQKYKEKYIYKDKNTIRYRDEKEIIEKEKEEIEKDFKEKIIEEIEKNKEKNQFLLNVSKFSKEQKENININNSFSSIGGIDFEKRKINNSFSGRITFNKLVENYDVRDMIYSIEKLKNNNITNKLDYYIQGLLNSSGIENINIMFISMIFELLRKHGIYKPPLKNNLNCDKDLESKELLEKKSLFNSFSILDAEDKNK